MLLEWWDIRKVEPSLIIQIYSWKQNVTYYVAILKTSVEQAAAITAFVDATAGIILFTTPK